MSRTFASRLLFYVMVVWLVATVAILLGATASALRDASIPVEVGLIRTSGFSAVCATLAPAVCGIAAIWCILQGRLLGPALLFLYSVFWLVSLGGGILIDAFHSSLGGIQQAAWQDWLVAITALCTMIVAFLLMALWSFRHLRATPSRKTS